MRGRRSPTLFHTRYHLHLDDARWSDLVAQVGEEGDDTEA